MRRGKGVCRERAVITRALHLPVADRGSPVAAPALQLHRPWARQHEAMRLTRVAFHCLQQLSSSGLAHFTLDLHFLHKSGSDAADGAPPSSVPTSAQHGSPSAPTLHASSSAQPYAAATSSAALLAAVPAPGGKAVSLTAVPWAGGDASATPSLAGTHRHGKLMMTPPAPFRAIPAMPLTVPPTTAAPLAAVPLQAAPLTAPAAPAAAPSETRPPSPVAFGSPAAEVLADTVAAQLLLAPPVSGTDEGEVKATASSMSAAHGPYDASAKTLAALRRTLEGTMHATSGAPCLDVYIHHLLSSPGITSPAAAGPCGGCRLCAHGPRRDTSPQPTTPFMEGTHRLPLVAREHTHAVRFKHCRTHAIGSMWSHRLQGPESARSQTCDCQPLNRAAPARRPLVRSPPASRCQRSERPRGMAAAPPPGRHLGSTSRSRRGVPRATFRVAPSRRSLAPQRSRQRSRCGSPARALRCGAVAVACVAPGVQL